MRRLATTAALVAALLVCGALAYTTSAAQQKQSWLDFKGRFGKHYASAEEESKRFRYFVENMKRTAELQQRNPAASFGPTSLSDLSEAEFKSYHNAEPYLAQLHEGTPTIEYAADAAAAGRVIDWRTRGAVTPVKDQGHHHCSSCWAFASTGSIEGQWFLAGHNLTSLSEQELVSCDTTNPGCQPGWPQNAWSWLVSNANGSIATEASYPYVSGDGDVPTCDLSGTVVGATITGQVCVQKDENAMANWIYDNGPLFVAVASASWHSYAGGVMTNCTGTVDHAALAVGFNDTASPPYWIIKNSWGTAWGEAGYIYVEKGTNQCDITYGACSSVVAKPPPPPPTGPTTPAPPTPAPQPTFTQRTCYGIGCSDCSDYTQPQNTCITVGLQSFIATCLPHGLQVSSYAMAGCTGTANVTVQCIDQCQAVFGAIATSYYMTVCP